LTSESDEAVSGSEIEPIGLTPTLADIGVFLRV
jgi:hypothetical protein